MKISSRNVVEGTARAPHRAMYKAMGLTNEDLNKSFVGVCHTGNEATPCNIHLPNLAQQAKQGVTDGGATPREFSTIAVSDGIAMGHEGMKSSLISREVIADSIELMVRAHQYDALVGIAGCDKSLPGTMMGMIRLNIPSVFVYGGTIMPGMLDGKELTVVDVYEAVGSYDAGKITAEELENIENVACPNAGSCGGMFTANTMSTIAEAVGMMLPRGASHPADYDAGSDIHDDVKNQALASVEALYRLMEMGIRPRDIMVREAFENAVTTAYAMGGSTNLYLHVLAIAREADVPFTIEDMQRIGERVPLIANLQPHGAYAMVSLHQVGGVPVVMKALLEAGLLYGDVMTVTGKTLAENLAEVPLPEDLPEQDVVLPIARPLAAPGNHISVLSGSLAPESCLLKLSGKTLEDGEFRGKAKVFDSEQAAMAAIREGGVIAGDVIVVRHVGPVGAPGMPEMVHLTIQLQGRGLGKDVALITDGRFSGVSHGILVGHICPEGAKGGPIGAVRDGDTIVINPKTRRLDLDITPDELAARMAQLGTPVLSDVAKGSVLGKYRRLVSSAHYGCVL